MRVLFCVHQFFPEHTLGTERYTLGVARALRERGHDVLVYTTAGLPDSGQFLAQYQYEGLEVRAVNLLTSPPSSVRDHSTRPELVPLHEQVLRDFQPDLVHVTHLLGLGKELLETCDQAGVPVVMTFTDLWSFCWAGQCMKPCNGKLCGGPDADGLNCVLDYLTSAKIGRLTSGLERALVGASRVGLARPVYLAMRQLRRRTLERQVPEVVAIAERNEMLKKALQTVQHAFFPSRYLRDAFAANGLEFSQSTVLSYGIRQPTEVERRVLRGPRPREEEGPTFAFIGQLARHKGLHILLRAFREAAIPGSRLKLHGRFNPGDRHSGDLERQIQESPGVTMEGFFPGGEVYHVLAGCDAVVIPSLWHENAPLALLEALSAGKPPIIADGKGMVEFVRHGRTGLITRTGSVASLKEALLEMHEHDYRLPDISPTNPAYSLSPEDHAEKFVEEFYPAVLQDHPARVAGAALTRSRPLDLGRHFTLQPVNQPRPVENGGEMARCLARSNLRGCEVRLATPGIGFQPSGEPPQGMETPGNLTATPPLKTPVPPSAAKQAPLPNRTFPRKFHPTLSLRIQKKPFVSVWGRKSLNAQIKHLEGFQNAEFLTICARAKLARRSVFRVRAERRSPEGHSEKAEETWAWNWPVNGWARARLHLAGLRAEGWEDLKVDWIPLRTHKMWKLDLLEFELTQPVEEHPARADATTPHLLRLPTVPDPRGDLTFAEFPKSLPFSPQRVYWVYGIPENAWRGGHAHREVDEILVPVHGGFQVTLQSPRRETVDFQMNDPGQGLFLPHGWWRKIHSYQPGTTCLILSSGPYDEGEYIRDPEEFFTQ